MTEKSKITNIIHELDSLNVGEIAELIANIKERYNIKEEVMVGATSASTEETTAKKESSNVSVQWVEKKEGANLKEILSIIQKAVKELKGQEINPLDALKLTKKEDKIILENIPRDKAEEFQKKIEKGAQVEIKET